MSSIMAGQTALYRAPLTLQPFWKRETDYCREALAGTFAAQAAKPGPAAAAKTEKPPVAQKSKLSFKEQKELDGLPAQIATLEAEQSLLTEKLSGGGADAAKLAVRLGELGASIDQAMARWEDLESRR